eukprot:PRCOL_00004634-RA
MKRARVSDDGAGAAPAADSAPGAGTHSGAEQQDYSAEWAAYYAAHGYPQYQGQGAQYAAGEASQHQHQQQQPDPAFAGATGKDAELLAALGADNVVEVNAASMRAGRSASGAGSAASQAYADMRGAATTLAKPSAMAKRKHQLGALFHQFKSQEADLLEARGSGKAAKAQTRSKYGW